MDIRQMPPINSRNPEPNPRDNRNGEQDNDWYLFYSPRSPPCINFIKEAKKIDSVREKINLIDVDQNPREIIKDNPWIKQHGLPSLAVDGNVISGKKLFMWLNEMSSKLANEPPAPPSREGNQSKTESMSEPSAISLGETPFFDNTGGFSELDKGIQNEISTSSYSSIGAKQGCEGIDHEKYEEGSDSKMRTLNVDDLAENRKAAIFSGGNR